MTRMKTLQYHFRMTTIEKISGAYKAIRLDDRMRNFYKRLIDMEDAEQNEDGVLFAAMYHKWDLHDQQLDLVASLYHVAKDKTSGIMFVPHRELLGYLVSDMSIECFDREQVLGSILAEASYMGTDEITLMREYKQLIEQAKEIEESTTEEIQDMLREIGLNPEDLILTPMEEAYAEKVLEENEKIRDIQIAAIKAQLKQKM